MRLNESAERQRWTKPSNSRFRRAIRRRVIQIQTPTMQSHEKCQRTISRIHEAIAPMVDAGSRASVPARRMVEQMLDRVVDDAAALEAGDALDRVATIVREGSSADRQLRLGRRGASLQAIVRSLVDETRE